jgi:hypothetical protein
MSAVRRFIEGRLGLKLNEEKSKVDRPQNRKFLGFSFFRRNGPQLRLAPKTIARFKDRVREVTARSNGWSMERRVCALTAYFCGWMQYFRLARTPSVDRNLEGWALRRLRLCLWKQRKRPRTRLRELRALGLPDWVCLEFAFSRKGYWRMSSGPMNSNATRVLEGARLCRVDRSLFLKFDEPPDAGRHVRWCGRTGRRRPSYPILRSTSLGSLEPVMASRRMTCAPPRIASSQYRT